MAAAAGAVTTLQRMMVAPAGAVVRAMSQRQAILKRVQLLVPDAHLEMTRMPTTAAARELVDWVRQPMVEPVSPALWVVL